MSDRNAPTEEWYTLPYKWLVPAALAALVASGMPATASHNDWWDDDWDDDWWDDDFWDDDDLFDAFDDDDLFDDFWFDRGFGHRFRASWDFDFDSDDVGDLLVLRALGDGGCLDVRTLVLLEALDNGHLSRRDLRELAVLRALQDEGLLGTGC